MNPEGRRVTIERLELSECRRLGAPIRRVAQRYSHHNHGSKSLAEVIYEPTGMEAQAMHNGEVPLFMAKLEEEVGGYMSLRFDSTKWSM